MKLMEWLSSWAPENCKKGKNTLPFEFGDCGWVIDDELDV